MAADRHTYRARAIDTSSVWVCGGYMKYAPIAPKAGETPLEYKHLIFTPDVADEGKPRGIRVFEVAEETVCQCTGLKDVTGKILFENDIVLVGASIFIIKWDGYKFILEAPNGVRLDIQENMLKKGDIFENAEALATLSPRP